MFVPEIVVGYVCASRFCISWYVSRRIISTISLLAPDNYITNITQLQRSVILHLWPSNDLVYTSKTACNSTAQLFAPVSIWLGDWETETATVSLNKQNVWTI
jgi:hypothetical protein